MKLILIATIGTQARYISSDKLNNLYVITNDNSLVKYDSSGTQLFTYNSRKYGQLSYVDASNPLKLLVYYPDFYTAVLLDNTLSELSVMNLQQAGIVQPSAVCLASDNNVWVYDSQEFKLKKLDQSLNLLVQSSDLLTSSGDAVQASMILERDNLIFLNDPQKGIYVLDNYATYSLHLPFIGLNDMQEFNKKFIYFKDYAIQSYDLRTLETVTTPLPDTSGIKQIRIEKSRLFQLKENKVILYRY